MDDVNNVSRTKAPVTGAANFLIRLIYIPRLKKLAKDAMGKTTKNKQASVVHTVSSLYQQSPNFRRILNNSQDNIDSLANKVAPYV